MRGLRDKVVIVAGGASGIGAESARRLAEEGARVVVADRDRDGADQVAREITALGALAEAATVDISVEESCQELASWVSGRHGRIDALFNVAGDFRHELVSQDTDALEVPVEVWNQVLAVNLTGYLLTTRAVLPHLLAAGGGSIVNTLSGLAFYGDASGPAYTASKSALVALIRHVASKWGRDGIRCNGVAPGLVLTETALANWSEEERAAIIAANRSPRPGRPSDIAATAAFLLSDEAEWINGQVHMVTGGRW